MSFELDVSRFCKKAKKNSEEVIRQVTIKLFSAIILATPVDTGRLRGNWQVAGGAPASGELDSTDFSGGKTINKVVSFVTSTPHPKVFTLANNLPYAAKIEYGGYPGIGPKTVGGFSTQAPSGVVGINVIRFRTLLDAEASKVR